MATTGQVLVTVNRQLSLLPPHGLDTGGTFHAERDETNSSERACELLASHRTDLCGTRELALTNCSGFTAGSNSTTG